jgi:GT2 family glycosyltransferase/SAM-dependent methyltransferase
VAALVPADARRILDVGCGGGALGALLKQRPGVEVVGIEADLEAAERAATRLDTVLALDLEGLDAVPLPAGSFDCIICADVLEHLLDPERTLAALLPCLSANGTLIASIPNVRHQEVVLDLLVRGRWQYAPAGILDATHLRFYTATEIAGLLDRLGLQLDVTQANASAPDPALAPLADIVERLGGDRARFLQESQIIQYIFRARRAVPAARLVAPTSPARVEAPAARKASIVVLAWNELEYTRECVKSVLACTRSPYELILVDNGSTDATLEYFRSVPGAKVVANGSNLGFAGGNNRGILAATGDYVVILNNDTLVTEGWLEGLIAAAEEDPAIGIVGPMSNYVSGPQLVPDAAYGDWAGLQGYAQAFHTRHQGRRFDFPRLVGFCLLLTREVISRVGLLDESFGLGNFEDDDYCLRAQQAGFRLVVAGDVFIHHFGSRTFQGQGVDFEAAMRHGQEVFTRKWQGKIPPRLVPAASGLP